MHYTITHTTSYAYIEPVSLCHNIIKLLPRTTANQLCRDITIEIFPKPATLHRYEDFFGNKLVYFSIESEHRRLSVQVISEVEKKNMSGDVEEPGGISVEELKQQLLEREPESIETRQYIFETPMTLWTEEIQAYAMESFRPGRSVFDAAKELMERIYTDFEFKPGFTTIATPLSQVMQQRKGVCQDFAHLAIACVRSIGLPARYVSGYIETISPEGAEKLVGVDASHAWFSVYINGRGWVDFDPTNNIMPAEQHITIGWGRDYADIAPFKGVILSSGSHDLVVSVDVRRTG